MKSKYRALILSAAIAALAGCSSSPSPESEGPAWIHQPARTVDGGFIVYVGKGEDQAEQKAAFKAEGQALQDLANECSFAPKGTRVEDRYTREQGIEHLAFAKVAVDFQLCEQAKSALDAEQITKLANVAMTDEVKHYQELMNEPPPPPIAEQGTAVAAQGSPPSQSTVVIVRDEPSFFVVRQQVAWVKQTVILAPAPAPGVPPPPPPTQQLATLQGPSRELRNYETANPGVRTSQTSWSQVRTRIPSSMGGSTNHPMAMHQRQALQPHRAQQQGRGRKRKKKWN